RLAGRASGRRRQYGDSRIPQRRDIGESGRQASLVVVLTLVAETVARLTQHALLGFGERLETVAVDLGQDRVDLRLHRFAALPLLLLSAGLTAGTPALPKSGRRFGP